MDQNQLNNLRDIAQAAHNLEASRIARETAAATSGLLRAQEQQRALEQQRLAVEQQRVIVEQQRLQEEQRRTELAAHEQRRRVQLEQNEANEKKTIAERVKSIRVKMAAMEEEIGDFQSSLSDSAGNPPLTGGGPVATYQFLLLHKKLEKVVSQKSHLHELSDIRFTGQLEKSVLELRQTFPDFFGDSSIKKALQYLKDLSIWPLRSVSHEGRDIAPSMLVQEAHTASEGLREKFRKAETEIESSAMISRLLSEIIVSEQLLVDAEAAFTKEWNSVEPLIQDLQSVGIGLVEVQCLGSSAESVGEAWRN